MKRCAQPDDFQDAEAIVVQAHEVELTQQAQGRAPARCVGLLIICSQQPALAPRSFVSSKEGLAPPLLIY